MILDNEHVLVTEGTGSLGRTIVGRLLSGEIGTVTIRRLLSPIMPKLRQGFMA
jgi:FlaA1/EpsC-like NDP-sugar epimerase